MNVYFYNFFHWIYFFFQLSFHSDSTSLICFTSHLLNIQSQYPMDTAEMCKHLHINLHYNQPMLSVQPPTRVQQPLAMSVFAEREWWRVGAVYFRWRLYPKLLKKLSWVALQGYGLFSVLSSMQRIKNYDYYIFSTVK